MFGDQAVGGVINVITRTPDKAAAGARGRRRLPRQRALRAERQPALRQRHRRAPERRAARERQLPRQQRNGLPQLFGLVEYNWADGRVFAEMQQVDDELELPGALPELMTRA